MAQLYHSNATTNIHIRSEIQKSMTSNFALSAQFNVSERTVYKWKHSDHLEDKSSRPDTIHYSLSDTEKQLIKSIRASTWLPIDAIWEMILPHHSDASYSSVYRTLVGFGINKIPQEKKEKAKKFKEYEPGFLHIDVTYFPKLDGTKWYLFVAIDRATRLMFYQLYDAKTAENTEDFVNLCIAYFPFNITHILTDNGLEFTNALLKSKTGKSCTKPSKLDAICDKENIKHRLTQPHTPKTNGMVERANGLIKNATILQEEYCDKKSMEKALQQFLLFYILSRKHSSLTKELKVRTPYDALEKWYQLKPELFLKPPRVFKNNLLEIWSCENINIVLRN